jgi:hypothetical protein
MKPLRLITAGILLLLAGAVASTSAQQGKPGAEAKPRPRESPGKPEAQQPQDRSRPPGQARPPQQPEDRNRPPGQAQPRQRPHPGRAAPPRRHMEPGEQRGAWQHQRAHDWQSEHRTWRQRGGYRGYRIPPARFRSYFGRDHWFRIHGAPMAMFGRYPCFMYGGYWFRLADPWPESWSDDWYDEDDVSIDYYDDGYYLSNRHHPGILIALQIYLN